MNPYWPLQSQERFTAVNVVLVGLPFSVGWFYLGNDERTLEAGLISLLAGILFSASWSWLMWHLFIVKRVRQAVEARSSNATEPTSKRS